MEHTLLFELNLPPLKRRAAGKWNSGADDHFLAIRASQFSLRSRPGRLPCKLPEQKNDFL